MLLLTISHYQSLKMKDSDAMETEEHFVNSCTEGLFQCETQSVFHSVQHKVTNTAS